MPHCRHTVSPGWAWIPHRWQRIIHTFLKFIHTFLVCSSHECRRRVSMQDVTAHVAVLGRRWTRNLVDRGIFTSVAPLEADWPMLSAGVAGIRVVGLSTTLVGARVSQLLADFGAEVIEIEPLGGSALRSDAAWPFWGRGKKSIELDLKSLDDCEVARRIIDGSDVLIETFRPRVAERLGFGYATLRTQNPRLVYVSITGFGRQGPFADLKGYEAIVTAKIGGLAASGRMVERPGPAFPVVQYATFSGAQTALHALLAALLKRERSGRGQWVEANLLQGLAAHDRFNWFVRVISERFPGAFVSTPTVADGVPSGGLSFRLRTALTADGRWLQFSQTTEHLFRAFMRAVELDWMFDDPEWHTVPDFEDVERRRAYWEMLLKAVRSRTLAQWHENLRR